MKIHRLEIQQNIPAGIEVAWDFFSTPRNLNLITPDTMNFEIKSGAETGAYAGQVITYSIRPLLNFPMTWVTEITQCENRKYFIDEQRFGPYRFWHHQHHFVENKEGVSMTDILHYALPFGILGEALAGKIIHEKVKQIFNYREKKLNEIFQGTSEKIAS